MKIIEADIHRLTTWITMRRALWPECPEDKSRREAAHILASSRETAFLACGDDDSIIGFVEVSLRDYVEGASSIPVGYLEGIYMLPEYRNRDFGSRLVRMAELWAHSHGCTEIGSDTGIDNHGSIAFHKAAGFRETDRQIIFIKKIHDNIGQ